MKSRTASNAFGPRRFAARYLMLLALFAGLPVAAFQTETIEPVPEKSVGQAGGFPGSGVLATHPSRVYARQSESAEWIYFQADAAQRKELLALFLSAPLRDHIVEIKAGPANACTFDGAEIPYTVLLEIPDYAWNTQLHPERECSPMRLVLLVDADNAIDASAIPDTAQIQSELPAFASRVSAPPTRTRYRGRAPDENRLPSPRSAWERPPSVLLHDTTSSRYVWLGLLNENGSFSVWLSEDERARLDTPALRLIASQVFAPGENDVVVPLTLDAATAEQPNR